VSARREVWMIEDPIGGDEYHDSEHEARRWAGAGQRIIHLREVDDTPTGAERAGRVPLLTPKQRRSLERELRQCGTVQRVLLEIVGYQGGSRTEAIARWLLERDAQTQEASRGE
jgi:hypothetical protein